MHKFITVLVISSFIIISWATAFHTEVVVEAEEVVTPDIIEAIKTKKVEIINEIPTSQAPLPEEVVIKEETIIPTPIETTAVEPTETEAEVDTKASENPLEIARVDDSAAVEQSEKVFQFETMRDVSFGASVKDTFGIPVARAKVEWINPQNDNILLQGMTTNTGRFLNKKIAIPQITAEVKLKIFDPHSGHTFEQMVPLNADTPKINVEAVLTRD